MLAALARPSIYRGASHLASPLIRAWLINRRRRGKEDAVRFAERLGRTKLVRPDGTLIWLHAASVGESISLLPLITRLQTEAPHTTLLMTTGTVTSARLMAHATPFTKLPKNLEGSIYFGPMQVFPARAESKTWTLMPISKHLRSMCNRQHLPLAK